MSEKKIPGSSAAPNELTAEAQRLGMYESAPKASAPLLPISEEAQDMVDRLVRENTPKATTSRVLRRNEAHTDYTRELSRILTGSEKGHLPESLLRIARERMAELEALRTSTAPLGGTVEGRLVVTALCDMRAFETRVYQREYLERAINLIEGRDCFPGRESPLKQTSEGVDAPVAQPAVEREAPRSLADRGSVESAVSCPNASDACREELRFIVSYLAHNDQDANHAWMVRRIRAVLNGTDPSKVEPWSEYDGVRRPRPAADRPSKAPLPSPVDLDAIAERFAYEHRDCNPNGPTTLKALQQLLTDVTCGEFERGWAAAEECAKRAQESPEPPRSGVEDDAHALTNPSEACVALPVEGAPRGSSAPSSCASAQEWEGRYRELAAEVLGYVRSLGEYDARSPVESMRMIRSALARVAHRPGDRVRWDGLPNPGTVVSSVVRVDGTTITRVRWDENGGEHDHDARHLVSADGSGNDSATNAKSKEST